MPARFAALLALLLLSSALRAQVAWQQLYGGPFDDACEVRALPDGGGILLASINSWDTWLMRFDAQGSTLWSRTITWADFCSVAPTYDGGFCLAGTTRSNHRAEAVFRLDALGDSIWADTFPDPNDHGVYRIEEDAAHNFIVTGYAQYPNNTYDMWARKLDPNGQSLWARAYGTPGFELGAMPALLPDGGYVFTTTQDTANSSRFFTVRTDAAGQVVWQRAHSPTQGQDLGGPVVTALPGGDLAFVGWIKLGGGNYNSYLLRTDSTGIPRWARNYGGLGFEERTAAGVIADKSGGFSFVTMTDQTFGPGLTDRDIALYHLDSTGQTRAIRRIGYPEDDVPRSFAQTPDSGYVILGYSRSFTPTWQQVYLAKLNASGCDERFYWPGFGERDTICPGTPLVLDAGPGYAQYLWSTGDTTRQLSLNSPDTVSVAATDSAGCIHHSNWCRAAVVPGPGFTWSSNGLQVQFQGNMAGQWLFGEPGGSTGGGIAPSFSYPSAGTYLACLVAQVPGCGPLSVCDSVVVLGVGSASPMLTQPSLHPNPAAQAATLHWPGATLLHAELFNAEGRRIAQASAEGEALTLDLSGWPSGLYLVRCTDGQGRQASLSLLKP